MRDSISLMKRPVKEYALIHVLYSLVHCFSVIDTLQLFKKME